MSARLLIVLRGGRRLALAAVALSMLNGCAFVNRDNTPTFNLVEEHLWPENKTARAIATPALIPLGFAALAVDAAVVHPLSVIDDAAKDTKEALWEDWEWDKKYMSECAALPWRTAATPVVFTFTWVGRSLFDVSDRAQDSRDEEKAEAQLAAAEKLMEEGKPSEALDTLKNTEFRHLDNTPWGQGQLLLLRAARQSGRYEDFAPKWARQIATGPLAGDLEPMLQEMESDENPFVRWTAIETRLGIDPKENKTPILQKALADPNPVLRNRAIGRIAMAGRYGGAGKAVIRELKPDLERIARDDPDAMNRADAERLIR